MSSAPQTLLADLYHFTMACGFWQSGKADQRACFHLFFRKPPFEGGYTLCSGLGLAIEALQEYRFGAAELDFLASLTGSDGSPLFPIKFLDYLSGLCPRWDIDAVPEGTVVFAQQPVIRVVGGLMECQLIESLLLNLFNYSSLISTKATRICQAAAGAEVLEFGLRRSQGPNGALMASRAAYIGGCAATSNVAAGYVYGIPVRGTHSHSWVLSFENEAEAFAQFAAHFPANCVLLVDTYNTKEGIQKAIDTALKFPKPEQFLGIRLDSGDLAYLSRMARDMLDAAGLQQAKIFAGNDLDEEIIESLRQQQAQVSVWAVGTNLVTGRGQPALGGVYKLTALEEDGIWQPKLKISEDAAKINIPGHLQIRRFFREKQPIGDMVYQSGVVPEHHMWNAVNPANPLQQNSLSCHNPHKDLLVSIFREGQQVYQSPTLPEIRQHAQAELADFDESIKRFINPHAYPAGLEKSVYETQLALIARARKINL